MESQKYGLIYIIEKDKIKEIILDGNKNLGDKGSNIESDLGNKFSSSLLGSFKYQNNMWIYQNLSKNVDSLVNNKNLNYTMGANLDLYPHVLIKDKNDNSDDSLLSIVYVDDISLADNKWKVGTKKDLSNINHIDDLQIGDFYQDNEKILLRHNKTYYYFDKTNSNQSNEGNDALSIRIKERTGKSKRKERKLLKDINLDISKYEMVLVLGGSGAGKTTFVNAVSGYEKATAKITYKGIDLYERSDTSRKIIRIVPQFDTLRSDDTVYNTLKDACFIQLSKKESSDEEKLEKEISRVLKDFGLEMERDNFVKKLSGGQRKRLSIAVEYISQPDIFFLDEPDSGLDAGSSINVMKLVRKIVNEGKIAIIISHNPDRTIELYDKVLVIAKDTQENCGQMAFYGNIDDAKTFFKVTSLEEIVMRINDPDQADYFIKKFKDMRGEMNV